MKNIPAGTPVLVVVKGTLYRARTTRGGRQRIRYKFVHTRNAVWWAPRFLELRDEGRVWTWGWEGVAADALRAGTAMLEEGEHP